MNEGRCDARGCDEVPGPVWAVYPDVLAEHAGHTGTATLTLPLRRCARGHLSGWRSGDDFLGDVVLDLREIDDRALGGDGVAPRRRLLRGRACGNCAAPLELQDRGTRCRGQVRVFVHACPDPLSFDVDLPDVACAGCGARPSRHGAGSADLPTDLVGWILAWIAVAMPPERAAEVTAR